MSKLKSPEKVIFEKLFDPLSDLKISIHSELNLQSISTLCDGSLKRVKFNHNQIQKLETLRDMLLPKLMYGEVGITL